MLLCGMQDQKVLYKIPRVTSTQTSLDHAPEPQFWNSLRKTVVPVQPARKKVVMLICEIYLNIRGK